MKFFEAILVHIFILSALLCDNLIFKIHALSAHELDFGESDEEIIEGVSLEALDDDIAQFNTTGRKLTAEEEELANEARREIAKVVENNLVRLFAVIASRGQKFGRQEDDPDEEDAVAAVTAAPNVLPQVAQILGAIFSNNLNLTRIVDQTFGLVPNVVRMQLMGLVKLLTGRDSEATTLRPEAPEIVRATTVKTVATSTTVETKANETTVLGALDSIIIDAPPTELTAAEPVNITSTPKPRYRIKSRTTKATTENSASAETASSILEDDELERLEKDLRATARIYEPYVRDKSPRFFVGPFRTILNSVNFNSTEILRAVPNIFKGARRAFVLLESLGVVREIVDDLQDEE